MSSIARSFSRGSAGSKRTAPTVSVCQPSSAQAASPSRPAPRARSSKRANGARAHDGEHIVPEPEKSPRIRARRAHPTRETLGGEAEVELEIVVREERGCRRERRILRLPAGWGALGVRRDHLAEQRERRPIEALGEAPRRPRGLDRELFAAEHGLKIGTIADLIEHRSRTESLVEKIGERSIETAFGSFTAHAFRDKPSQGLHLALVKGQWQAADTVAVRVHEPLSVLDALEVNRSMHSWGLDASLRHIAAEGKGVAVLLNCGESAAQLLTQFEGTARASQAPERGRMDLRTYGVGAQILRECGVHKMNLMGNPRRMPSMAGYGLEIAGYISR